MTVLAVRALAFSWMTLLGCMPVGASTQVLEPQGSFQMYDSEWALTNNPLSAYRAYQRQTKIVEALPDCAALKLPYNMETRCQVVSRCVIPGTSI